MAAKTAAERAATAAAPATRTESLGKQGQGARGGAGAGSSGDQTDLCDADGFRLVQRRRPRPKPGTQENQAEVQCSDADDVDMDGEAEPESDAEDDGDAHDDEGAEAEPEPTELRQRWQQEVGIVRRLARQGLKPDHPAMVAACDARDEAEKKWRGAKPPAPLATRLGWAQKKVDRAIAIQSETRHALEELDKDYKAKRSALQARMDEDAARVRKRRQQLQAVQDEAGGTGAQRRRGEGGEAVRQACNTIRLKVAPALAALAEQLGTGTEAWSTVNGLLSTLTSSQQVMEEALEEGAPNFDIADGDESVWSESHELQEVFGDTGAQSGDGGGWQLQQQQQGTHPPWQQHHQQYQQEQQWPQQDDQGHGAEGGGAQQWQGWHQANWTGAQRWREEGHGHWTRTSWADAWEHEHGADAEMDEPHEPQSKHRRQGGAAYDSEGATGAGGGAPAAAGQSGQATTQQQSACDGDRQRAEMLSHIMAAAIAAGVQPVTSTGDDLQVLDAQQLAAWAADNLPPN